MKKILITGGTGFIGRCLKEYLSQKYAVSAPSHKELELLDRQVVCRYLKENRFDLVIHSATCNATRNSPKDTSKVLPNNLKMFFNLAQNSKEYGRMIYFGSGAEYSRKHFIPKMKESYFGRHIPADSYGLSKYIMAEHAMRCSNIYNLRLFGVFGRHEDWQIRFISNACCKAVWNMPITIKQNVFFDYLYIDDLIKITEWFIENEPKEKVYNLCTGQSRDLLTLAKKVLGVSGKKLDIRIADRGLKKEYSGDNAKMLKEIGNYAFADMNSCISRLYQWYLARKDSIDKNKLLVDK